jgi:hypothetical protein
MPRGGCPSRSAAPAILGQDVVDHNQNAARLEQEVYDTIVHHRERER